jgi:hypothetical protein
MRYVVALAMSLMMLVCTTAAASASGVPDLRNTQHVYLIIGENTEITQVNKNDAPFLTGTLKPAGAWLTNYFALTHFSEANYVGMMAGQFNRCQQFDGSAASCHVPWDNLFSQLDQAGVSWQSWLESMPSPCALSSSGAPKTLDHYGAKHNPAIFFDNVEGTGGVWSSTPGAECTANDLPAGATSPVRGNDMSVFNAAVQGGSTAQFNLVVPNECEDGHDNCMPQGNGILQFDAFLRSEVPLIQRADSIALILITFDEGTSNKGPANSKQFSGGGNVVFLALGPQVHPAVYTAPSNHYGLLKTLEDGYGVPELEGAQTANGITAIWK